MYMMMAHAMSLVSADLRMLYILGLAASFLKRSLCFVVFGYDVLILKDHTAGGIPPPLLDLP